MSVTYFDYSVGATTVDVVRGPATGRRITSLSWRWA